MDNSGIWLSVIILLLWAGWWFGGAPTEGFGLWLPTGMTWFWFHQYLTQLRHGEILENPFPPWNAACSRSRKDDEIPGMEWNLEKIRRQKETE